VTAKPYPPYFCLMDWYVHLRNEDGQEVRHPVPTFSQAIATACVFLRDGLDVVKIVSAHGFTFEADVVRDLCNR